MNDPFSNARIERYTNIRQHAETAVEIALLVCEATRPLASQLRDIEDAVAALRAKNYQSAIVLAERVIEARTKLRVAIQPVNAPGSVAELREALAISQAASQQQRI